MNFSSSKQDEKTRYETFSFEYDLSGDEKICTDPKYFTRKASGVFTPKNHTGKIL
jgi:hypothetical protein